MKLIIDQNIQIKQMETKFEKLIKEKEDNLNMVSVPLDVVPLSQLPSTGATSTTTSSTQTPSAGQVTQTLQNMSLQSKEFEILQGQLKSLEVQKAKAKSSQTTKLEKSQILLEKLH